MKRTIGYLLTAASLSTIAFSSVAIAQEQSERDPYRLWATVQDGVDGVGELELIGEGIPKSLDEDARGSAVAVNSASDGKEDTKKPTLQSGAEAKIDKPVAGAPKTASAEEALAKAEVGVDWSGYAGALVDKWFDNLRRMEFVSKKVWVTKTEAKIGYTCFRDGHIGRIIMLKSCGNPAYDKMQLEALKLCQPLPPFPEGSKRNTYALFGGWGAHPKKTGEGDFKPGSFGKNLPVEKVPIRTKVKGK